MSLLKTFTKYHSLGNDFVIFDWLKKPLFYIQNELLDASWKGFVIKTCDRHFGIGADGVIVIANGKDVGIPEIFIFNADGSQGLNCLNGIRCVADYLVSTHHFPNQFMIQLAERTVSCTVNETALDRTIITNAGRVTYVKQQKITINGKDIQGHVLTIGNPHYIIFEEIDHDWLKNYGGMIESNQIFPDHINVEFIWPTTDTVFSNQILKTYKLLVYERGCGITFACSSGAAAATHLLYHQELINKNEKIVLRMLGGDVITSVDEHCNIILQASAQQVYGGAFQSFVHQCCSKSMLSARE